MTKANWHNLSSDEVLIVCNTQLKMGLSAEEVQKRILQFGANRLPDPAVRSLVSIFAHQFLSPLIYLLLIASAIAILVGNTKDAVVILIVVLLNSVIGAIQEGRAEHSLAALRQLSAIPATVLRGGQTITIDSINLVPGDILILSTGERIPADSRLIEAVSLTTSESALTGESVPVQKSTHILPLNTLLADRTNMIYAGTQVTSGRGRAVVVGTGTSNEIGKIATLATNTIQPKTQLELRIHHFGKILVVASLVLFVAVIALGLIRGISLAQIFMIAISQMVSLVPEGLPVAMTIALATGVQRMARKKTVVRRLSAVETLGATTVICTDKTGTLTRNEMTVTTIYLPGDQKEFSISGLGYTPQGQWIQSGKVYDPTSDPTLIKLLEACCLCNDAQLLEPTPSSPDWNIIGDPTEGALLTLASKAGFSPHDLRANYPRSAEIPFDSDVKMMATQNNINNKHIIFIKGAPESLLEHCGFVYKQGISRPLEPHTRTQAINAAQNMASSALRVLAFGFVEQTSLATLQNFEELRGQITLIGMVGELDPPREDVAAAIQACQGAGIRPVMVTGDHKQTALAIAKSLGIGNDSDLAIDGSELDQLHEHDLLNCLDRIRVFARVHPEQKLRIVKAYQSKGEVVAMTGDGVNDAPALVRANVGVAMGRTGTEVAKEASKIVITDDRFETIVSAIGEGRLVYQNIKKLLLFLFVTSIDEVIILFLALLFGFPPPLAAVQILWINLVTEGALTINLVMEPPEGGEMNRPPLSPHEPLIDRRMIQRIPLMVFTSVVVTFGWYFYRLKSGVPQNLIQSETFTILAVSQWFNILNCRSETRSALSWDFFKNPWLVGGLFLANALQIAVIYIKPLGAFFHTTPIAPGPFLLIGAIASLVLWTEELRKIFRRKFQNSLS